MDLVAKRLDDLDVFDPNDIELLFVQDEAMASTPAYEGPGLSVVRVRRMSDEELGRFVQGCKDALLLPLSDRFRHGIALVAGFAMGEQQERAWQKARREMAVRKAKLNGTYQEWENADLVAEVSAVCGEGRRQGDEWWFRCPWHEDHTPSLHVNAKKRTWHAFCCGRQGGVVQWRRMRGEKN